MKGKGPRRKSKRTQRQALLDTPLSIQAKETLVTAKQFVYEGQRATIVEVEALCEYPTIAIFHILNGWQEDQCCKRRIAKYKRGRAKMWVYKGQKLTFKEIATWVDKTPDHLVRRAWHQNLQEGSDVTDLADMPPKSRRMYRYKGRLESALSIATLAGLGYGHVRDKL